MSLEEQSTQIPSISVAESTNAQAQSNFQNTSEIEREIIFLKQTVNQLAVNYEKAVTEIFKLQKENEDLHKIKNDRDSCLARIAELEALLRAEKQPEQLADEQPLLVSCGFGPQLEAIKCKIFPDPQQQFQHEDVSYDPITNLPRVNPTHFLFDNTTITPTSNNQPEVYEYQNTVVCMPESQLCSSRNPAAPQRRLSEAEHVLSAKENLLEPHTMHLNFLEHENALIKKEFEEQTTKNIELAEQLEGANKEVERLHAEIVAAKIERENATPGEAQGNTNPAELEQTENPDPNAGIQLEQADIDMGVVTAEESEAQVLQERCERLEGICTVFQKKNEELEAQNAKLEGEIMDYLSTTVRLERAEKLQKEYEEKWYEEYVKNEKFVEEKTALEKQLEELKTELAAAQQKAEVAAQAQPAAASALNSFAGFINPSVAVSVNAGSGASANAVNTPNAANLSNIAANSSNYNNYNFANYAGATLSGVLANAQATAQSENGLNNANSSYASTVSTPSKNANTTTNYNNYNPSPYTNNYAYSNNNNNASSYTPLDGINYYSHPNTYSGNATGTITTVPAKLATVTVSAGSTSNAGLSGRAASILQGFGKSLVNSSLLTNSAGKYRSTGENQANSTSNAPRATSSYDISNTNNPSSSYIKSTSQLINYVNGNSSNQINTTSYTPSQTQNFTNTNANTSANANTNKNNNNTYYTGLLNQGKNTAQTNYASTGANANTSASSNTINTPNFFNRFSSSNNNNNYAYVNSGANANEASASANDIKKRVESEADDIVARVLKQSNVSSLGANPGNY